LFAALLPINAIETDEGVLVLTDSNFDEAIKQHEGLLVEFYAPWCGHCKKLAPEYAAAAAVLGAQDPPMYVAKVDATENNALAERFEIKGFPTMIWFRNGQKQDYTGGRTKDTIIAWINKKTGPASNQLNCGDFEQVQSKKLAGVYFGDFSGALFESFMEVAKVNEDFEFFHAAAECAPAHSAQAPGVSVFRTFDNSPVHHSGDNSVAQVAKFLEVSAIPVLITFSEDYIEPIFGKGRDALILFTNDGEAAYNAVYKQAAEQLKGEVLFVVSGTDNGIQQRLAEFVGVTAADAPSIRLLSPGEDMKKFVFPGALDTVSVHAIKNYIDEYKSGALRPHLKSEAEPAEQGPVTVLVGTNFERIVMDGSKDVLVKYYAPWCGHCKSLAPIWEELGQHVAEVNDLVIAKFDATANEVDGLSIRGYPTLRFYPKDNKAGYEYEGDRDLEAFKEWLASHSNAYKKHFSRNEEL
jgi:protein disulfide-isomerase A1